MCKYDAWRNPWVVVGGRCGHGGGKLPATGCNQVERARVNMEWDSMNEQRRAMACWGRDGGEQFGGSGVEGVV